MANLDDIFAKYQGTQFGANTLENQARQVRAAEPTYKVNKARELALNMIPFGKILDKATMGDDVSGKEILTEAALTAIPYVGKLGKAAKVAKATKVGLGFTDSFRAARAGVKEAAELGGRRLAQEGAEGAAKVGFGQKLQAEARGLAPASKVGSKTLSAKDSAAANQYLNTITKAKRPSKALADLESHLSNVSTKIGSTVQAGNRALSRTELQSLRKTAEAAVDSVPGMKLEKPLIKDYLDDIVKNGDHVSLHDYRKMLDEQINYNSPNVTPKIQQALKAVRESIDKFQTGEINGLKGLNKEYSQGKKVLPFVQARVRSPKGVNLPVATKLGGVSVGGEVGDTAKAALGGLLSGAPRRLGPVGKAAQTLRHLRPVAAQAGVRAAADAMGLRSPEDAQAAVDPSELVPPEGVGADTGSIGTELQNAVGDGSEVIYDPKTGQYSVENKNQLDDSAIDGLLQQALSAPDAKTQKQQFDLIAQLLSIRKAMTPASKSGKKTEAQVAREDAASIASDALADLEGGGIATGPITPKIEEFKSIFNAGDEKTVTFNRKISALKASIAKARAGTSFTPNEEKLLNQYAPKIGDSEQQLRTKLRYIQQVFADHEDEMQPETVEELVGAE